MKNISNFLSNGKLLVSDGAWGTYLFKKGLTAGSCPEEWNLTNRNFVIEIADSYAKAGADIISTNSFGANIFKLTQYGLADKLYEICKTSVELSKKVAYNKIIMASLGPTGKFLILGDVTLKDLYNSFMQQAIAFEEGGADAVCIETFYDLDEAEQAVNAVKENTQLEVICTFTFIKASENNYKTLMGISPEQMTESLLKKGVDIVGANCGSGFSDMVEIVKKIRSVSKDVPIMVQANAGIPILINGNFVYSETPEKIKEIIPRIIDAGANIVGGCCGTTPDHIRVISEIINRHNQMKFSKKKYL